MDKSDIKCISRMNQTNKYPQSANKSHTHSLYTDKWFAERKSERKRKGRRDKKRNNNRQQQKVNGFQLVWKSMELFSLLYACVMCKRCTQILCDFFRIWLRVNGGNGAKRHGNYYSLINVCLDCVHLFKQKKIPNNKSNNNNWCT